MPSQRSVRKQRRERIGCAGGWLKGQGEYCNARNLMVRETCYVCSYRIKPWDWSEAARKQEFEWEKHSRAQFAMLNKNQNLRGSRGGREKRSKKKLKKKKKHVVIILIDHHIVR